MTDWQEWFDEKGDDPVKELSANELYDNIKARLMDEVVAIESEGFTVFRPIEGFVESCKLVDKDEFGP